MENPFPTELPPSDPSAATANAESTPETPQGASPRTLSEAEQAPSPQSAASSDSELSYAGTHLSGKEESAYDEAAHPEAASGVPNSQDPATDESKHLSAEQQDAEPEEGTLEHYARRASHGRLNPEEESEAARLLREALSGGRAEVARAVAVTPQLPWVVTVQATAAVWPDIKPTFRAQFLAGLARTAGEAAARVRLSLARGLFKVDPAASLKLILLTLKVLRNKETCLLEGKGASILANVLIGRGKAWVIQLPLADLKPAEGDLLVFATLHGAFHQPQAPLTQLSILKWAAAADRLSRMPQALEEMVLKGVSRWSGKWQASLRREVSPLPDSWVELLKSPSPNGKNREDISSRSRLPKETGADKGDSAEDEGQASNGSFHAQDSNHLENGGEAPERGENEDEDEEDLDADEEDESDSEESAAAPGRRQKQRPVYVSKTVPGSGNHHTQQQQSRRGGAQSFNLQDTLRQVEQYVAGLRNDLQAAHKQLRQREDDNRRHRRNDRPAPVANPADLSLEEAIRLNHQLESRNAELQVRIDELTLDSEARAASRGLVTDTPVQDANTELRTLLGFKLKEDFEDFQALEQEARDLVVQQHYRTVLRHVFEVLGGEGVRFEGNETQ